MTVETVNFLRDLFEHTLDEQIRYVMTPIEMLKPMLYSLKNGGKRLRPLLLLTVLNIQSVDFVKKGLKSAMALEYIHTYSLIHDDLPAMDNDDLRRGQPTSHKKFDEATAILAGDALLTDAFGLIVEDDLLHAQQKVELVKQLSHAAGSHGMVAGQLNDMRAEEQKITVEQLEQIHRMKTSKLFIFAVQAAAIIAELDDKSTQFLIKFGQHFGTAYQIHNDLLDNIGTEEETGKLVQGDILNEKNTYPNLLGLSETKQALADELELARHQLQQLSAYTDDDYEQLAVFLDVLTIENE